MYSFDKKFWYENVIYYSKQTGSFLTLNILFNTNKRFIVTVSKLNAHKGKNKNNIQSSISKNVPEKYLYFEVALKDEMQ